MTDLNETLNLTTEDIKGQFTALLDKMKVKAEGFNELEVIPEASEPKQFGHFTMKDLTFPIGQEEMVKKMVDLLAKKLWLTGRLVGDRERNFKIDRELDLKNASTDAFGNFSYIDQVVLSENPEQMRLVMGGINESMVFTLNKLSGKMQIELGIKSDMCSSADHQLEFTEKEIAGSFSKALTFIDSQLDVLGETPDVFKFIESQVEPRLQE